LIEFMMWKVLALFVTFCSTIRADTLIIEKIHCQRVATGIDNWARAGAAALGGLVAGGITAAGGGATAVGTGGATLPVTAVAVAKAAAAGSSAGLSAIEFMNGPTSGQDDLIVTVNGKTVYPEHGKYAAMEAGYSRYPDVSYEFETGCEIQLIEYDSGSDNDDMGSIRVDSAANDRTAPGADYWVDRAVVMSEEEGSLYYITYRVIRSKAKVDMKWALCGTAACKDCSNPNCQGTSNSGLDRDKDKSDLKSCPYPLVTSGYKEYPQSWPFADVYLRICRPETTNAESDADELYESLMEMWGAMDWFG